MRTTTTTTTTITTTTTTTKSQTPPPPPPPPPPSQRRGWQRAALWCKHGKPTGDWLSSLQRDGCHTCWTLTWKPSISKLPWRTDFGAKSLQSDGRTLLSSLQSDKEETYWIWHKARGSKPNTDTTVNNAWIWWTASKHRTARGQFDDFRVHLNRKPVLRRDPKQEVHKCLFFLIFLLEVSWMQLRKAKGLKLNP